MKRQALKYLFLALRNLNKQLLKLEYLKSMIAPPTYGKFYGKLFRRDKLVCGAFESFLSRPDYMYEKENHWKIQIRQKYFISKKLLLTLFRSLP